MATTDTNNPNSQLTKPVIIALGLVLAAVIFFAGLVAGRAAGKLRALEPAGAVVKQRLLDSGMRMGRRFANPNESRIQGVVTAVNGSTLTVSGGGATNTVTVSGSTQYTNGTKAAVNDSVVVFGTVNNGSFTASRIVLNP